MQIEYGVSLSFKKKVIRRGSPDREIPQTVFYTGRRNGELIVTEESHMARHMTKTAADSLASWLSRTTTYTVAVVELIGGDSDHRLPDSLVELGEAISLDKVQKLVGDCAAQGVFSREDILAACQQAVNE